MRVAHGDPDLGRVPLVGHHQGLSQGQRVVQVDSLFIQGFKDVFPKVDSAQLQGRLSSVNHGLLHHLHVNFELSSLLLQTRHQDLLDKGVIAAEEVDQTVSAVAVKGICVTVRVVRLFKALKKADLGLVKLSPLWPELKDLTFDLALLTLGLAYLENLRLFSAALVAALRHRLEGLVGITGVAITSSGPCNEAISVRLLSLSLFQQPKAFSFDRYASETDTFFSVSALIITRYSTEISTFISAKSIQV